LDYKLVEEEDMVIYGDKENIKKFSSSPIIFADGTFQICPLDWYQLYILNGIIKGERVTFFYVLLKGKTKALYKKMFDKINYLTEGGVYGREYTLIGDFEIMNFDFLGKNVRRKCCHFHFCQSIERNYNEKRHRTKEELKRRKKLKKELMALSLCPLERVEGLFEFIKNSHNKIDEPAENFQIINYFENNYLKGKKVCPMENWNVCGEEHRTNNISESFNRELRHYFSDKSYFNGGKSSSRRYFESLLYQYIRFEIKYNKYKVTRKKNYVLDCKNQIIENIRRNAEIFDEKELLVVLLSILEMGKHKTTKKEQTVTVDDEYFETRNDSQLDNLDGEDGIGNDINELVEETQCMKEEEINEINEPKVYKTVMDKKKHNV